MSVVFSVVFCVVFSVVFCMVFPVVFCVVFCVGMMSMPWGLVALTASSRYLSAVKGAAQRSAMWDTDT